MTKPPPEPGEPDHPQMPDPDAPDSTAVAWKKASRSKVPRRVYQVIEDAARAKFKKGGRPRLSLSADNELAWSEEGRRPAWEVIQMLQSLIDVRRVSGNAFRDRYRTLGLTGEQVEKLFSRYRDKLDFH